ncbi:MAG TPA: chemotaxis protein CheW [Blastocatellia bacterium]|nr:chemotaxis protein CheW [Blastocatellia bacterium]
MIEDKALLSEYLSESEELLDSLLSDLDLLSTRGGDANLINRVFRTVHSLKGLSGMMGLAEVQSLAHEFEDILDDLRLGQLALNEGTIAALQEAGAGLAALVGGAARGSASDEDFERLRQLLTAIAFQAKPRARKPAAAIESLALSERERGMLTDYERHRLSENLIAGRVLFAIAVQFEIRRLEAQYRALTSKLAERGELITTLPEKATGVTSVGFRLVFASQLRDQEIKALVEPFGGRVSRLDRSGWRRAGEALKLARKKPEKGPIEGLSTLPPEFAQEALQPLTPSVRVELAQIDELSGLAHELSIQMEKLTAMADRFLNASGLGARDRFDLRFSTRRVERDFLELEERLVELRMISVAQTFTRAARLAGRLARQLGKSVSVEVTGRETHLDKVIVDRLADSIYHVLRNAIDHGVELPEERRIAGKNARGKIKIEASLEGTRAKVAVSDDGRGIDPVAVRNRAIQAGLITLDDSLTNEETIRLILRPGFSTADQISAVSGRGVGLDAVERTIHELGGEILISSEKGKGARFEFLLPTTLVMLSAFLVRAGDWRYAINVGQILELLYVSPEEIQGRDGKRSIAWRDSTIPLVELKYLLGLGGARVFHQTPGDNGVNGKRTQAGTNGSLRVPVFITRAAERTVGVAVERFEEQREIIVKSLGSLGKLIKGVTGAVDLEGGDVALVLDLPSLLVLRSLRM